MLSFPDSHSIKYSSVNRDLMARMRTASKSVQGVSIKSCPMPRSLEYSHVTVTAKLHSWVASVEALKAFHGHLSDNDRSSLLLLRD